MLSDDKSGIEADYRRVLAMVEELPESVDKNFMLAEILSQEVYTIKQKKLAGKRSSLQVLFDRICKQDTQ